MFEAVCCAIDPERGNVSLGIKQLQMNPIPRYCLKPSTWASSS